MNIIKLDAIASTNSYLKDLSRSTLLEDGTVVVTSHQLDGRGQQGAVWKSQQGKSLTFSMFKRFKRLNAHRQFDLSMAVSLALVKVLVDLNIPEISVKWPNDIMSAQKKCAGILIENRLEDQRIVQSVIGVGLNVNEAAFKGLPQATSMLQHTGRTFNLDELLFKIATGLKNDLQRLEETSSLSIHKSYEQLLFRKDLISVFEDVNRKKANGIIRGVTPFGLLRVEHDDDLFKNYDLKEVKLCY